MIQPTFDQCCGCTSCVTVCPKGAISMGQNEKGAYMPVVNLELCVDCGLCDKACNFRVFQPTGLNPRTYAARMKDMNEVATSRSGGFFMALCHVVIDHGGVVFGCQLDQECHVKHTYETTYEGCQKFKGSKYVESDMGDCFQKCIEFLKADKFVLFSGTGCQIHGLLQCMQTLHIPTEKLLTIAIVCHGAPAAGVWQAYKGMLETKQQARLVSFNFRDKSIEGWMPHIESYVFDDGESVVSRDWTRLFYDSVAYRDSCYNCPYTTPQRLSDFTIADYWGIERNAPQFADNKGVSLVLIHSEKGAAFFEESNVYLDIQETKLGTSMQPQLRKPIAKGYGYSAFWNVFRKSPERAIKSIIYPALHRRVYRKLRSTAGRWVRHIKKMLKRK